MRHSVKSTPRSFGLPPYRYLPGRSPHPQRHPEGHMRRPDAPQPRNRRERLAHALALFEARYYWEAHEAWETQWHVTANEVERALLKALIQLAAGHLKNELGETSQARSLYTRACVSLEPCAHRRRVLSLELDHIRSLIAEALRAIELGADPHRTLRSQ